MVRMCLAVALLWAMAGPAMGQTLGDVARAEAARRKAVAKPGRVYTNESLRPEPPPSTPPPAVGLAVLGAGRSGEAAPAADAPAPTTGGPPAGATATGDASGLPSTEAGWRTRAADLRGQVIRQRILVDALQARVDGLWMDFVNRDDPAQRAVIESDRFKALAELDRVKLDLKAAEQAVTDLEELARRRSVPPGWLR